MNLLLVGDVQLGRLMNEVLWREPPEYPWGDTLPLFQAADWRVCNLECVIADRGTPWSATPKVFHFRTDAKNVAALEGAGIDAVSLANNHSLDFGYDALFEMLEILDRTRIARAGAGRDLDEACRAAVCRAGNRTIELVSFTDNEPAWEAEQHEAGVFYVPVDLEDQRATNLLQVVRCAKEQVDLVIVAAHWGPNWGYRPVPAHPPFARALIDAGADLVFGHSCHVFQGIEIYKGRPILYSTGDFVDDYAVDPVERNDRSFVFVVGTDDSRVERLRLYPTVIRDFQVRTARGREAEEIADKMRELCAGFGTEARWSGQERCLTIDVP
ncbi:MAG: CapA family protein [Gemmatimonadetes bacterium]|nr:CapA family protein [Gemmatimonadota bacterium]